MHETFVQETLETLRKAPYFSKKFLFKTFLLLSVGTFVMATHLYIVTTCSHCSYAFHTHIHIQHYELPLQIRISKKYHEELTANKSPERKENAYTLARAFAQNERAVLNIEDDVQAESKKLYKESLEIWEKRRFTKWSYAVFFSIALFISGCLLLKRHLRRLGIYEKTIFFALRVVIPRVLRGAAIGIVFSEFVVSPITIWGLGNCSEFFIGAGSPERQRSVDQYAIEHGLLSSESMEKVNRLVWESFRQQADSFVLLLSILSAAIYGALARRWSKE